MRGNRYVRTSLTAITAGAVLLSATALWAQPLPNDNDVQVSAGFFHTQGSDSGTVNFQGSYGKFLNNPSWEVGLRGGLDYAFIDNARDTWLVSTVPYFEYHFLGISDQSRIVPVAGAFLGLVWNDRDATGTAGPSVGAKFFLNDQTYLVARYQYQWFFSRVERAAGNFDDGNHIVNVGLGYQWGGSGTRIIR